MQERRQEQTSVDDALAVSEELSELRAERREQIREEIAAEETRSDGSVFTGYVEDLSDGKFNVSITVSYVDDGQHREATFSLSKPSSSDDFTAQNDLVRFVKYVGDGAIDEVEKTLDREVPLKKTDGSVQLDLPNPDAPFSETHHRTRRRTDAVGLTNEDFSLGSLGTTIASALTLLMSGLLYQSYFAGMPSIGKGIVVMILGALMSSMMVLLGLLVALMIERMIPEWVFTRSEYFLPLIGLAAYLTTDPSMELMTTTGGSAQLFAYIFLLFVLPIVGAHKLLPAVRRIGGGAKRRVSSLHRRYRLWQSDVDEIDR